MRDRALIGSWIRRFLLEHLVSDRNLTRNTQASYRDTLLLLLPFVSQAQKRPIDRLMIDEPGPIRRERERGGDETGEAGGFQFVAVGGERFEPVPQP